jgi:hypothetical protein
MRPLLWLLLLWFSLLMTSSPAAAQECTTYVVAAVLDPATGAEIDNLKVEDFVARAGSTPLPVVSAERNFSNRLLVLLETDGAATNDKVEDEISTIANLARQAPEGKPISLGVYAGRAVFTKDFNPNEKERTAEINGVIEEANALGKNVALFDALHEALAQFGPHQPGDTVLLIADPYDDSSRHTADDVEKEYMATGTRLAVMLRQPLSRVSRDFMWSRHDREKATFETLTARTGGSYTIFGAHIFRFPWKGYMLGVQVPQGAHVRGKWKLKLSSSAEVPVRHPKIYYPERLPACSGPTTAATAAAAAK